MSKRDIVFVAAENGALPGAKVGGVGDVIRWLPAALVAQGQPTTVLTPSYGVLHKLNGAQELEPGHASFRGRHLAFTTYLVPGMEEGVRNIVFHHPLFMPTEPGVVYHNDTDRPYATDADKFAMYCAAVAAWIESQDVKPAAVHLHDWHAGVYAVLRAYDPHFKPLQRVPAVLTVHNLSYQGQRPFRGDPSSLESWFPDLDYDADRISDPINGDCFNPMAAAIRLADCINTVSPSNAGEIVKPSAPALGFIGGEGLEQDLQQAASENRLVGILNGCDYSAARPQALDWPALLKLAKTTVDGWQSKAISDVHSLALQRLSRLPKSRPEHVLTGVGRVVAQKMRLFLEPTSRDHTALEEILGRLGQSGVLLLLGSGEERYERLLAEIAAAHDNFVYMRGYSEPLGNALYASGDVFLMPSSFEPCGISQMFAMRDGQPCVVHGVGGLLDTVKDGHNGFVFNGESPREQADNFVACVDKTLKLKLDKARQWRSIQKNAAAARFDWASTAQQYIRLLYERFNR